MEMEGVILEIIFLSQNANMLVSTNPWNSGGGRILIQRCQEILFLFSNERKTKFEQKLIKNIISVV